MLIIEDNEDIRSYLCSELENDYKILQAENGEQGFKMAVENIPDLIISDIMMSKLDGIQVANQLKTLTPVGTATNRVVTIKKIWVAKLTPEVNIWCTQTMKDNKQIHKMA